jgi:hypothetical protein
LGAVIPAVEDTFDAKGRSEEPAWHIRAYLKETISSASAKPGDTFEAVIAEQVFNTDHSLAFPRGLYWRRDHAGQPAPVVWRSGETALRFSLLAGTDIGRRRKYRRQCGDRAQWLWIRGSLVRHDRMFQRRSRQTCWLGRRSGFRPGAMF